MRPPLLWIAIGFGAGLWAGLAAFSGDVGSGTCRLLVGGRCPGRATGAGGRRRWDRGGRRVCCGARRRWRGATRAARDTGDGGRGSGDEARTRRSCGCSIRYPRMAASWTAQVQGGVCGGDPDAALARRANAAAGGTTWLVAGPWVGDAERGLLRVRSRPAARRRAARARRPARSDRGAQPDAVRRPRPARRRARHRAHSRPRLRAARALRALRAGPHPVHLGAARRVLRGLAGAAAAARRRPAAPAARLLRARGVRLLLDDRLPGARDARGGDARGGRGGALAPAGRGAARHGRARGARGACWSIRGRSASVGAWLSVSAIAAVIWAGAGGRSGPPLAATRGARGRRDARDRADHGVRLRHRGADRRAGESGRHSARRRRGPGRDRRARRSRGSCRPSRALLAAGSGFVLALLDLVAGAAAARPRRARDRDPGWPAALDVGRGAGGGVVAVEFAAPPVAHRRAGRVRRRGRSPGAPAVARAPSDSDGVLTVHFLDVGQGDAAALRTPAGHWVLIDGGPRTPAGGCRAAGGVAVSPAPGGRRLGAGGGDARRRRSSGRPAGGDRGACRPGSCSSPGSRVGRPLYLEFLADVERDGRHVAPGAHRRSGRAGRRDVPGAEPRQRLGRAAGRRERGERRAAGDLRRDAAAVHGRRRGSRWRRGWPAGWGTWTCSRWATTAAGRRRPRRG